MSWRETGGPEFQHSDWKTEHALDFIDLCAQFWLVVHDVSAYPSGPSDIFKRWSVGQKMLRISALDPNLSETSTLIQGKERFWNTEG